MFDTPLIKRPACSEGAHLRALKSLDLVEQIALPSVEDLSLLTKYIESSKALMASGQTGTPPSHYRA